jgi:hypothetical protein
VTAARVVGSIGALVISGAVAAGMTSGAALARSPMARSSIARAQDPHPTQLAGAYWAQLRPNEKQIYLAGFLAGAAAEQVRARALSDGTSADSLAVSSHAIGELRAARSLQYRFATPVYSAQIDDFYWWQNHREVPIVDAMIRFNGDMLKQQTEGRP